MLFLAAFVLVVAAISALVVWPRVDTEYLAARPWRAAGGPASAEGALAAQLTAGQITGRQYVQAMERLAALEDDRLPFVVPPSA
jgi:hypothetical protein